MGLLEPRIEEIGGLKKNKRKSIQIIIIVSNFTVECLFDITFHLGSSIENYLLMRIQTILTTGESEINSTSEGSNAGMFLVAVNFFHTLKCKHSTRGMT